MNRLSLLLSGFSRLIRPYTGILVEVLAGVFGAQFVWSGIAHFYADHCRSGTWCITMRTC